MTVDMLTKALLVVVTMNLVLISAEVPTYIDGGNGSVNNNQIRFNMTSDGIPDIANSTTYGTKTNEEKNSWLSIITGVEKFMVNLPFIGTLFGYLFWLVEMSIWLFFGGAILMFQSAGMPVEIRNIIGGGLGIIGVVGLLHLFLQFWKR